MTDAATTRWIRDASDELAVRNGCKFDEERGQFVVDWIQNYCRLYEGELAGEFMTLADWQYDCTMRLFGWVRYSEKWSRWIRRFRQASIWIPKKNGKSPTLAAWGLYLLAGDGEPGQKVFLAAKDGMQAREIAGKHAIEMTMSSPEMDADCQINKSLMRITHTPTRSILQPLSSANSRTQQSKEGLNGSICIDEVHVVDREFVNRISRAGISRSEPLHIEVSTAGNNPDGYGKERFDYAQAVARGQIRDDELLVSIYAAPQNLSDSDLAADPAKYARMANPTLGRIVDELELLKDYERSRSSIDKLGDFKMYRLNIWQRAANPWLSQEVWQGCESRYTEDDCEGLECWAGLDLSLTRDMTAFALCFKDGDEFRLSVRFWLPEEFVANNADRASYRQWQDAGLLTVIPGATIDHNFIRPEIIELIERFKPNELAFDKTFAQQLVTDFENETGVSLVQFPQNPTFFTQPCGDFERLLLEKRLHHNGNAILSWQAGHVCLDKNAKTGLCRPVKPQTGGSHLTIDGIVASVMASSRAIVNDLGTAYDNAIGGAILL